MMRKALGILILFFTVAMAGNAVDYRSLEVEISMNPAEYRGLLDRFIQADTTLTPAEVSKVYYGFSLSPSYEPRDSFPEIRQAYREKDYQKVDSLLGPALELNPVSLDLLLMGKTIYGHGTGTTPGAKALNMAIRFDQLVTAILDSGRGTFAQSPFYVICSEDRDRILYDVLRIGELTGEDTVGDIDAVKFCFPGRSRLNILYFDNTAEKRFLMNHP